MYVDGDRWSTPDAGDPAPCFRQGDLVRVTWVRPEVAAADDGDTIRISAIEVRTETVALLSACCDLVSRSPPKRLDFALAEGPAEH